VVNHRAERLYSETVKPAKTTEKKLPKMERIASRALYLADRFNPAESCTEHFFAHKGAGAVTVYFVHALVNIELARRGHIAPLYCAPSTLKKLFGGHGRADKDEIRAAVREQYGVDIEDNDQADAFCLAVCARDHYLLTNGYPPMAPNAVWQTYHKEKIKGWKRSL